MTQLTKDDIDWVNGVRYIAVVKLQEVITFYSEFVENQVKKMEQHPELFEQWMAETKNQPHLHFIDWLFRHCFMDGLK